MAETDTVDPVAAATPALVDSRVMHPAVDYGFGLGGAPRPSSRRGTTPPRVPRPRPAPLAAATPFFVDSFGPHGATSVRPRPRKAYIRTPLWRFTPSLDDTPTAYTRSDALGNAAELRFADSVARCSHDDWKQGQHAEPTCHAMMRYVSTGLPSVLPPDFWRATSRTSVHPSQTSRSWRVRVDYIQPTTTSSYSSVTRHCHQQGLTNPTLRGELLAC